MTAQPPRSPLARSGSALGLGADAGLVSGEAVELEIRAARLGSRGLALLIDIAVQSVIALLLLVVGGMLLDLLVAPGLMDQAMLTALRTVGLVLVLLGYPVLWETLNHGRTVGKLAVGLRVVRDDGGPVGFRQALTRGLVGVAVEWPGLVLPLLTWAASVTVMMTDPRGRRLGDLAAGTMVIHQRSPAALGYVPVGVPALAGWAGVLDLTRLDDSLALAVRQLLSRSPAITEPARRRLARSLWAEVAAVTSPPPPPGLPDWAYLATVLAERHRRARRRLAGTRSAATALWPELAHPETGTDMPALPGHWPPPGTSARPAPAPPEPTVAAVAAPMSPNGSER